MHDLVGTWRLVDWTFQVDGDKTYRPYNGDATGLLTYTDDGRMCASLMKRARVPTTAKTINAATARERARLASTFQSYAGSYRIDGDTVIHDVEVSLFPNWVGGEQLRHITWQPDGDGGRNLLLSTPPEPTEAGRTAVNRLLWRRIGGTQEEA